MAKVEWHQGELFPRVEFIVTNLLAKSEEVVHFYNGRGTALVHHARRLVFQTAEVAVPRKVFAAILEQIGRLRRYGSGEDDLVVQ